MNENMNLMVRSHPVYPLSYRNRYKSCPFAEKIIGQLNNSVYDTFLMFDGPTNRQLQTYEFIINNAWLIILASCGVVNDAD